MALPRRSSEDVTWLLNWDGQPSSEVASGSDEPTRVRLPGLKFPIPVPDPLGFVEEITGGRCQDPVRAFIRNAARKNW